MKAVVLVGGEGTRLRPLTCNTPKPMLPLANLPLLEHRIAYLKCYGIEDVILSMCYRPDVIKRYFGDGSRLGVRLSYVVESAPLGTAGGVKNVESYLDDQFFVFNGDILTNLNLSAMLEAHHSSGAKVSISLTPVDDPTAYGLVETSVNGRVRQFVEKPSWDRVTTNLINAGTYILDPEVLAHVPRDTFWMFERGLFPLLLERGDPVYGFASDAYWLDIGTPEKYLTAHSDVLSRRITVGLPGRERMAGIWLQDDVTIDSTAELVPPLVLGRDVEVEAGARLVGPLVLGDRCVVQQGSTLERAVIWHGTTVEMSAKVKDCMIGADCLVREGTEIAGAAVVADGCVIGRGNRLDRGIKIWPSVRIEDSAITF